MKYYMKKIILSGLIGLSSLIGNMSYQSNSYAEQKEIIIGEPIVIDLSKVTEVKPGMYHNQDLILEEVIQDYVSEHKLKSYEKRIIVDKSDRKLSVYINNELMKEYGVSLGTDPVGDKIKQGDRRTPEGEFYVARKIPNSKFHKALLISYPNKEDAQRGLESKLITKNQYNSINSAIDKCQTPPQNTILGNYIELHGMGGGPGHSDWTWGCVALNNGDIDELYDFSSKGCGTKIIIQK